MISTSQELPDRQNADGGWSYGRRGGSWTEPTCYALLALVADGLAGSDAARRAMKWLAARQRADGGWAPRETVEESTWVTALVLLLPFELAPGVDRARALAWLLAQTGLESSLVFRLRLRLLGVQDDAAHAFEGWPWSPGTAAWVMPTAMSILALEKHGRRTGDTRVDQRVAEGRAFLLARRCADGGWNHGATKAFGYDSGSYPETTAAALLALHGSQAVGIAEGVAAAERHLASCKSQEPASWLILALLAQNKHPSPVALPSHGGTLEIALAVLARAAQEGRNVFLE